MSVTTAPDWTSGARPVLTFYIGPTNPKGRHPAVSQVTMTPVILFNSTFMDLYTTIGRFFNKELPVVILGRSGRQNIDDAFIPRLRDCRFLHREARGRYSNFHVLSRIYTEDSSGDAARKVLHSYCDELEMR